MIPEFITTNPATNRPVSEAPPATESTSTDLHLNNDGFQKALQKQATERAPQDRNLPDADLPVEEPPAATPVSEARPEPTRPVTDTQSVATESNDIAESPDAPKPRDDLQPRADSQSTRQNPIAPSDARDDSATATRAEPAKLAQNSQSESDGFSQQILRIDQGTPTVEEPQPGTTLKTQTTDPTFVSTAASNPGTLPSLVRRPLDQLSVNQLLGDFVFDGSDPNAAAAGNLPLSPVAPTAESSAEVDLVVRPFLNDALLPDDLHRIEQDFRVTSTEPSLNQNSVADAQPLPPKILIELHDLLPFPTLPSLRPDVAPPAQVVSETVAAAVQLFNGAVPESTAGIEVSLAEVDAVGTVQPFDIQPSAHVIVETTLPLALETYSPTETLNPETAPLVLPSLSTEVNRATLTGTAEPIQQFNPVQPSTPDSSAERDSSASVPITSFASGTEVAEQAATDPPSNQNGRNESSSPPRGINTPQISNGTADAVDFQGAATDRSRQPAVVVPQQNNASAAIAPAPTVPLAVLGSEPVVESSPVEVDSRAQRLRQTRVEAASKASATTESTTIEDRPANGAQRDVSVRPIRESRPQNDGNAVPNPAPTAKSSVDTVSRGVSAPVTPDATSSSDSSGGEIANDDVARRPAKAATSTVQDSAAAVSVENSDNEVRIEAAPQPVDSRQSARRCRPALPARSRSTLRHRLFPFVNRGHHPGSRPLRRTIRR